MTSDIELLESLSSDLYTLYARLIREGPTLRGNDLDITGVLDNALDAISDLEKHIQKFLVSLDC